MSWREERKGKKGETEGGKEGTDVAREESKVKMREGRSKRERHVMKGKRMQKSKGGREGPREVRQRDRDKD